MENAPIYNGNKNSKMVSLTKMVIRGEFLFQATEIELGQSITPVLVEMNNSLTVAKVKSIITPKPVITPRRLAAFEKANKTRNMIVGSFANRIRQRVL